MYDFSFSCTFMNNYTFNICNNTHIIGLRSLSFKYVIIVDLYVIKEYYSFIKTRVCQSQTH